MVRDAENGGGDDSAAAAVKDVASGTVAGIAQVLVGEQRGSEVTFLVVNHARRCQTAGGYGEQQVQPSFDSVARGCSLNTDCVAVLCTYGSATYVLDARYKQRPSS